MDYLHESTLILLDEIELNMILLITDNFNLL